MLIKVNMNEKNLKEEVKHLERSISNLETKVMGSSDEKGPLSKMNDDVKKTTGMDMKHILMMAGGTAVIILVIGLILYYSKSSMIMVKNKKGDKEVDWTKLVLYSIGIGIGVAVLIGVGKYLMESQGVHLGM